MAGDYETIPHIDTSADVKLFLRQFPENFAERRDYFLHMQADEFMQFVQQIDALARNKKGNQAFDRADGDYYGDALTLQEDAVPDGRDIETLFEIAWDVTRGILKDYSLADAEALELAAVTVAGVIILSHPFIDSNGRTSRIASYAMASAEYSQEQLSTIIMRRINDTWSYSTQPFRVMRPVDDATMPTEIAWTSTEQPRSPLVEAIALSPDDIRDAILQKFLSWYKQELNEARVFPSSTEELDAIAYMNDLLTHPSGAAANAQGLLATFREARAEKVCNFLRGMRDNPGADTGWSFRDCQLRGLAKGALHDDSF